MTTIILILLGLLTIVCCRAYLGAGGRRVFRTLVRAGTCGGWAAFGCRQAVFDTDSEGHATSAYIRRRELFVLAPRLRHALIAPASITRDA